MRVRFDLSFLGPEGLFRSVSAETGENLIKAVWLSSMGLLFFTRLAGLQLEKYVELKFLSQVQQIAKVDVGEPRRTIVDCHGNILAIDLPAYDLYAHPSMFPISSVRMARILAPILEVSVNYLQDRFGEGSTGICLMRQISTRKSTQLLRLGLDGLELVRHPQRLYPQRGSLAHVLGYVDTEGSGQAGIEASLDHALRVPNHEVPSWTDGRGNFLGSRFPKPVLFHEESVVQLTLDVALQDRVSQLVQESQERFGAKRIAAIIMEAHTGAIRCLATTPSYDPNLYSWFPMERFRCWPMTDLFEPGSTFKPINLAIAIENGILHPTERILDTGNMLVGDNWIRNVGGGLVWDYNPDHLTPTQILQRSSNVGMVRIMQALDPEIYHRNLVRLGIGSIDSTVEHRSQSSKDVHDLTADYPLSVVKERYEFINHEIEPATAAFGQGIAMTPIKLLQLIAALANGGISVTPHIVWGILPQLDSFPPLSIPVSKSQLSSTPFQFPSWFRTPSLASKPLKEPQAEQDMMGFGGYNSWTVSRTKVQSRRNLVPEAYSLFFGHIPVPSLELGWFDLETIPPHARERRRLFSPQTCRVILGMLEQVILEANATGSRCFIPGYPIAGKTGTAQKPSPDGGYFSDSVVTSFVGIYPVSQPRFVTLVIIDDPIAPFRFAFNTAADLTQAALSELICLEGDRPIYPTLSIVERTI